MSAWEAGRRAQIKLWNDVSREADMKGAVRSACDEDAAEACDKLELVCTVLRRAGNKATRVLEGMGRIASGLGSAKGRGNEDDHGDRDT